MKKIVFCASESLPFIKTGGLADVIGSLPEKLVALGNEVSVFIPLYKKIAHTMHHELKFETEFYFNFKYHDVNVRVLSKEHNGVKFYLIENANYFERDMLYGYHDDGERFAYFQRAILEYLNYINYKADVIHAHDWHCGMIPCLIKEKWSVNPLFSQVKTVFTIHNLAYQGIFSPQMLESCLGLGFYLYENGKLQFDDCISFMKAGIEYADKVTTVSETYAKEITTSHYGERLEAVLNSRIHDLCGIVNGIDTNMWCSKNDDNLVYNFNRLNVHKMKRANKLALQKELGLEEDEKVMLVSIVTRLTWQKGIHLILERLNDIYNEPIQMIILGSGDLYMEQQLSNFVNSVPKTKMVFINGYNESLAHRIYASSDLFLMPSLFEPCGISQLISMRYGTLPLVRETGGLKDTVEAFNEYEKTGNGFSFTHYNSQSMLDALRYAIHIYYANKTDWNLIVKNAMKTDVSWEKSAVKYSLLYDEILKYK